MMVVKELRQSYTIVVPLPKEVVEFSQLVFSSRLCYITTNNQRYYLAFSYILSTTSFYSLSCSALMVGKCTSNIAKRIVMYLR